MRSVRFRLPSPSMAVALLALFVALGGSSYAALKVNSRQIVDNSVRSKDLRNNDVRSTDVRNNSLAGADINEALLGTVPSASTAGSAATAGDSGTLGGIGPNGFVRTPTEAVRLVGTSGNPDFQPGWANKGQGASTGFFKDQFGVVHIQGEVDPPGSAGTVFVLPAGYRPDINGATGPQFPVVADGGLDAVQIKFDGDVVVQRSFNDLVSLNGITFVATH
jgi:hypothetical protein